MWVLYLWEKGKGTSVLYGKPLDEREPGEGVALTAFGHGFFTEDERSLVINSGIFRDTYGMGILSLDDPEKITEVPFTGLAHEGVGEYDGLGPIENGRFILFFNIDGATWAYEAEYDPETTSLHAINILIGKGVLSEGLWKRSLTILRAIPSQLHFLQRHHRLRSIRLRDVDRDILVRHTNESILGIPKRMLSRGEDYSYTSYDGTRVSPVVSASRNVGVFRKTPGARLRAWWAAGPGTSGLFLVFHAPDPVPDLAGFRSFRSQCARQHSYGLTYTKQVDHDWGGADRLDHVHAMKEVLFSDERLDISRAGVVGRSYGGYMTLTLAGRHPDLWAAAVDMFGPMTC